jgi:serine/threonine-protein kinase HipA
MFDVNPIPYGNHLSLNVSENDSSIDFELALVTAKHYGLSEQEATKIMNEILKTVTKNWYTIAKEYGLSSRKISEMEPAFVVR